MNVELTELINNLKELNDFYDMYDDEHILNRMIEAQEEIDDIIYKVYGLKKIKHGSE